MNIWKLCVSVFLVAFFVSSCTNAHQRVRGRDRFSFYADGDYVSSKTFYSNDAYLKERHSSEAVHRATLKSYETFGIKYYPKVVKIGSTQRGIASWYGPNFHGKKTSNGEIYDMHEMTAAHKTLPMNTIVLVKHLETDKTVKVRINDRGPFVAGRIIDLSYAAGKMLGLDKTGTAMVELRVEKYDSYISSNYDVAGNPESPSYRASSYGVQIGAFSSEESANRVKAHILEKYNKAVSVIKAKSNDKVVNKVIIEGFSSQSEADDFVIKNSLNARVVQVE